mgnify:CR=1 FL=1
MRKINICLLLIVAISSLYADCAVAQAHGERKLVREGNAAFKERDYGKSLDLYNRALGVDSTCMEAAWISLR